MTLRKLLGYASASVAALALACAPLAPALAQGYPTSTPVYIPTPVKSAVTCSAACDVVFNTNGVGTMSFRIAGSGTGIAAIAEVSDDRAASPTYTQVGVLQVGGVKESNITATGLYRVNTAGMTSVDIHLTAVTGSVTIAGAATPGMGLPDVAPKAATYSATVVGLAPAASATDIFAITGNATTTVRVLNVHCAGIATTAGIATIEGVLRSTADTGTAGTPVAYPLDPNDPAADATLQSFTANPTTGAAIGVIRADKITLPLSASMVTAPTSIDWNFGGFNQTQEVVLRGAASVFAISGAGASFPSGTALNCSVTWTEE